jgi:hypothetical protein
VLLLLICAGVFAFPLVTRADGLDDKPPAGIVPTAATLQAVLAAHAQAFGAKRWTTDIEEGRIVMFGLKGTYRDVYSQGDYRRTS